MKAERDAWRKEFAQVDPAQLVFLDESGATTAMDRTYGRSASGKQVDGPVPHGHWNLTTLTAAVRLDGVIMSACQARPQATTAFWFLNYVTDCLVPSLRPGEVVIMDNLSSHKGTDVVRQIESVGAKVRFLPASSPDFNPIEAMFSKMKQALRSVSPDDIKGWFRHCGYQADRDNGHDQ